MPHLLLVLLASLRLLFRSRLALVAEIVLLREQLVVLRRRVPRAKIEHGNRVVFGFFAAVLETWRSAMIAVGPDTVVRFHRGLWRHYWSWRSRRRKPGRPRLPDAIRTLIRDMSTRCPRWGAKRIQGELRKLGHLVACSTIRRHMARSPRAGPPQTWRTFIRNHMSCTWAADFFTVYTATFKVLYVLVVFAYGRRRVVHVAVTDHPTSAWTARQLVEATPFEDRPRFLVCDNDPLLRGEFARAAKNASIEIVRTPPESPNCSPYVERFIRSVRGELLDHVIVWGERHLLGLVREYTRFFVKRRPHQGLGQEIPVPDPAEPPKEGRVVALPVLGGLQHDYIRRAA